MRLFILMLAVAIFVTGNAQAQVPYKSEWALPASEVTKQVICGTEVGTKGLKTLPETAIGNTQWAIRVHQGPWNNGRCSALVVYGIYTPVTGGEPIAHARFTEDRGQTWSVRIYGELKDIEKDGDGNISAFTLEIPKEKFGNKEQDAPCGPWIYKFRKGQDTTGSCGNLTATLAALPQ